MPSEESVPRSELLRETPALGIRQTGCPHDVVRGSVAVRMTSTAVT